MFPKANSTINIIYPNEEINTQIQLQSKQIKSIFNYWLLGGNVNIHLSFIQHLKKFENQYYLNVLFQQSYFQKLFTYPQTWSLSQIKSIQDKNKLEYVVGKFLFGKQRNTSENKILKT